MTLTRFSVLGFSRINTMNCKCSKGHLRFGIPSCKCKNYVSRNQQKLFLSGRKKRFMGGQTVRKLRCDKRPFVPLMRSCAMEISFISEGK